MGKGRTLLALLLLAGILAVIILTWGSIGSAAMVLGLLLAGIGIALKKSLSRDVDDYFLEE